MIETALRELRQRITQAKLHDLLWQAYEAGFAISTENFNSELPNSDAEIRKAFERWVG